MKSWLAIPLLAGALSTGAAGSSPAHVRVFVHLHVPLSDVTWTGTRFLYVVNTTNVVFSAGPRGGPVKIFAIMPNFVDESHCRASPGRHGFPRGWVYCHSPDNKIYRIGPAGEKISVLAKLPDAAKSDGALVFDTAGRFGFSLLAATGISGGPSGGAIYAVKPSGKVRRIGTYPGPGGADQLAIAPRRFGSLGGAALITVDGNRAGRLLAMSPRGHVTTVATTPDGLNPIAAIPAYRRRRRPPAAGLYIADGATQDIWFAPAASFRRYAGDVVVGSEVKGLFWIVRPRGHGFQLITLPKTLERRTWELENATYVG